jgi:hypothetical protein
MHLSRGNDLLGTSQINVLNIGDTMNKQDKVLMEKYGITSATKTVFFYKDFKYDDLDKAIRYAEHEERKLTPIPTSALLTSR